MASSMIITTSADHARILKKCTKMLRHGDKKLAENAIEQLLEIDIPLESARKFKLKNLVSECAPGHIRGLLIRRIQIKEEEEKELKKLEIKDDDWADTEEDEILDLMFTPTKKDFLKATEQLEECSYEELYEEHKDAPEFMDLISQIKLYKFSGRRTPSPKKETFIQVTDSQMERIRATKKRMVFKAPKEWSEAIQGQNVACQSEMIEVKKEEIKKLVFKPPTSWAQVILQQNPTNELESMEVEEVQKKKMTFKAPVEWSTAICRQKVTRRLVAPY